jgi:hypothetical protein
MSANCFLGYMLIANCKAGSFIPQTGPRQYYILNPKNKFVRLYTSDLYDSSAELD